jgi:hypothetical protein
MKGCVLAGKIDFKAGIPSPRWPTAEELAERARAKADERRGRR